MRTASFPSVRTTPELRSLVDSVLQDGETISTFIEETLRKQAMWRREDAAFYALALKRSKSLDAGKRTAISAGESIQRLRDLSHRKKKARKDKSGSGQHISMA